LPAAPWSGGVPAPDSSGAGRPGSFLPCTVIVLDEIQQYINEPGHPAPDYAEAERPYPFEAGRDAPPPFVNPYADIQVTSNSLPHWQQGETWIFVTWRLADSLPADKLRAWQEEKQAWLAHHPEPWNPATTGEYHERFTRRIEDWLDAGHGACILREPAVRRNVTDALAFFDSQRYELGDWVVMPNHVHVLFRPLGEHRLPDILQSWKSFTAKAINKALGRTGSVWQEDYWDRLIRNERHLNAVQRYIAGNPAKAGLREREWSGRFLQRSGGVPPPKRDGASRRT
jgi:type I restriction enzyme R subunit